MKKEIRELLNSTEGTLKINKYCTLRRYTKDCLDNDCDKIKADFAIICSCDKSVEIKSRDLAGIVDEVSTAMATAFDEARNKYIKEFKNGHIG